MLDVAFLGAVAVTVAWTTVAVAVAARRGHDALSVMAIDEFGRSIIMATAAVLAGRALGPDHTVVSDIVLIASTFGIASMATVALARRVNVTAGHAVLHTTALVIGFVAPFTAGITGWAA